MKQKTKYVEIEGKKYRINKLDARTACYIATKLAFLLAGNFAGETDVNTETLQSALNGLNKSTFFELQNDCLRAVQYMRTIDGQEMPEAVLKADGTFTDSELEYNFYVVGRLTIEVLMFNVSNFFGEKGSQKLKNFPQPLTNTSGQ